MTLDEKIAFLYNKKLNDAIGAGHATPYDYAEQAIAHLVAEHRGDKQADYEARIAQGRNANARAR